MRDLSNPTLDNGILSENLAYLQSVNQSYEMCADSVNSG